MPKDDARNSLSLTGMKDDLAKQADQNAAEPTPTQPPATQPPATSDAPIATDAPAKAAKPVRLLDRKRDYAQLCPPNGNAHYMQDDGFFDFHGNEVPDPHKQGQAQSQASASSDPLPSADELQNVHTNKIRALVLKAGGEWTGDRAAAIEFLTTARS